MATPVIRPPRPTPSIPPPPPPPPHPLPVPHPHPIIELNTIGKSCHNGFWAGFVIFVVAGLLFAILGSRVHARNRVFHALTLLITVISALNYYGMATGSGFSYVPTAHTVHDITETFYLRQVFWSRYVDWALTTPLIILNLTLLGGFAFFDILSLLVVNEAQVFTSLFAALHRGSAAARWGWYAFSCIFLLYVLVHLVWTGWRSARHQHAHVSTLYTPLAFYIGLVWLVYPIIFALGRNTGILSPGAENIAYTVLDIFGKVVFGLVLLGAHKHHDDEAHACRFPDSWVEPRGGRGGAIQLPGGEN